MNIPERRLIVLGIITLLLISQCSLMNLEGQEKNLSVEGKEVENDFNATLYNKLKNVNVSFTPRPAYMDVGERRDFKVRILCSYDISFNMKFLLISKEWIPSYKRDYQQGLDEDEVEFYHEWYSGLKSKTDNVYDIEYKTISLSSEETHEITNLSATVYQGGTFSIISLIKPDDGKYWVKGEGGTILKVDKPDNLINRLSPVIYPASIITIIAILTYSIKFRKEFF